MVERNNITLDGAGYTLLGKYVYVVTGITLSGRKNVTIKNMEIDVFSYGICLDNSSKISILQNNLTNNVFGIELAASSNNDIIGNMIMADAGVGNAIQLISSSYNNVVGNNIWTTNGQGIDLAYSSHNYVIKNNIANCNAGIDIYYSVENVTIMGNNITNSNFYGIRLTDYQDIIITGNNIVNNRRGITLESLLDFSNARIYHNKFINNRDQVEIGKNAWRLANVWDDGYPSGGNYWSDYTDNDYYSGPFQNETGSDGIGDTPYVIDADNVDHYPLTVHDVAVSGFAVSKTVVGQGHCISINVTVANIGQYTEVFNETVQANSTAIQTQNIVLTSRNSRTVTFAWNTTGFAYGNYTMSAVADTVQNETNTADNTRTCWVVVTILGDVNGDRYVGGIDLGIIGLALFTSLGDPRWNPNTDLTEDGYVGGIDLGTAGIHIFQSC